MPMKISEAPRDTEQLLRLGDEAFVQAAYLTILGRDADPSGLNAYVSLVRDGEDKGKILQALLQSTEASQRVAALPGLQAFVSQRRARENSRWRRLMRRIRRAFGAVDPEEQERLLRRIENRLIRLDSETQLQASSLHEVQAHLRQIDITLQTLHRASPETAAPQAAHTPKGRQVPPRVDDLFQRMRRALNNRSLQ